MQEVHVQYILLNKSSPKVSGTRSWNSTESTDGTSTFYCTILHLAALQEVQDVRSLLLLSRSVH